MDKSFASYVAIIVATGTEENAVKKMYEWMSVKFDCDDQTYYVASVTCDGKKRKISYARQKEMGMTVAVTLTMKLIEHFRRNTLLWRG